MTALAVWHPATTKRGAGCQLSQISTASISTYHSRNTHRGRVLGLRKSLQPVQSITTLAVAGLNPFTCMYIQYQIPLYSSDCTGRLTLEEWWADRRCEGSWDAWIGEQYVCRKETCLSSKLSKRQRQQCNQIPTSWTAGPYKRGLEISREQII